MKIKPDLKTDIGGIELENPVMTASGTFGYAVEFEELVDLNRLGGIIVKGLSLEPSMGNKPPRIFVKEKLPFLKKLSTPVFTNIYGKNISDYVLLAARIDELNEIAGIEVNISCPNVKAGGLAFGVVPETAAEVVGAVRKKTSKPLIVKLSPNVTDITQIARAVEGAGADSLSLVNTITGMSIDIETRRSKLANITGGLSGPAIKPVALRMVWQVAQSVKIPVIGVGGIVCAEDALEFLIAGAAAVQVGTANFVNPHATIDIIEGIEEFLIEKKISSIRDYRKENFLYKGYYWYS